MRRIIIHLFATAAFLLAACSNGDSLSVDVDEMSCAAANHGSSSSGSWVVSSSETALEVSSSSTESSSSELYISYGMMVDERDGQEYKTVAIGNLVWMAENLNYAYLQPTSTLDSSSWCIWDDLSFCNDEKFGRLYLWSAAVDSAAVFSDDGKGCGFYDSNEDWHKCLGEKVRGVCPEGWKLPTNDDYYKILPWVFYDGSAFNSYLLAESFWLDGDSVFSGSTNFWLATEIDTAYVYQDYYNPYSLDETKGIGESLKPTIKKEFHSVRCVKDE